MIGSDDFVLKPIMSEEDLKVKLKRINKWIDMDKEVLLLRERRTQIELFFQGKQGRVSISLNNLKLDARKTADNLKEDIEDFYSCVDDVNKNVETVVARINVRKKKLNNQIKEIRSNIKSLPAELGEINHQLEKYAQDNSWENFKKEWK